MKPVRGKIRVSPETARDGGAVRFSTGGKTLKLNIPPNTQPGAMLRLKGQGGFDETMGKAGDLLVEIVVSDEGQTGGASKADANVGGEGWRGPKIWLFAGGSILLFAAVLVFFRPEEISTDDTRKILETPSLAETYQLIGDALIGKQLVESFTFKDCSIAVDNRKSMGFRYLAPDITPQLDRISRIKLGLSEFSVGPPTEVYGVRENYMGRLEHFGSEVVFIEEAIDQGYRVFEFADAYPKDAFVVDLTKVSEVELMSPRIYDQVRSMVGEGTVFILHLKTIRSAIQPGYSLDPNASDFEEIINSDKLPYIYGESEAAKILTRNREIASNTSAKIIVLDRFEAERLRGLFENAVQLCVGASR